MRYAIDKNYLERNASLPTTFKKGSSLYRLHAVFGLAGFGTDNIRTVVKGSLDYNLEFNFDNNGSLVEWTCTCPASRSYNGLCKHSIAALLKVINKQEEDNAIFTSLLVENEKSKDALDVLNMFRSYRIKHEETEAEKLIKEYSSVEETEANVTLNMEIYLNLAINKSSENFVGAISLRIGDDRFYVVQRLSEFLDSFMHNKPYEFTKNMIYDPKEHKFNDIDLKLLKLLGQILEDDNVNRNINKLYNASEGIFNRKLLNLTAHRLDLLTPLIREKGFRIGTLEKSEVGEIIDEKPPIKIEFKEIEEGLELVLKTREKYMTLSNSGFFIFDGKQKIYRVPEDDRKRIELLYRSFKYGNVFTLTEKMYPVYLVHMHPVLEKMAGLKLPEVISDKLIHEPISKRAFIGTNGTTIDISYKFFYGEYEATEEGLEFEYLENGKILVRDIKAEEELRDFFIKNKYPRSKTGFLLIHENDQYDFITNGINELRELAQLYMTKDFHKCLKIKPVKMTYKIDVSKSTDWLDFKLNIQGIDQRELEEVLEAYKLKMKYYRRDNGEFLDLSQGDISILDALNARFDMNYKDFKDVTQFPVSKALVLKKQLDSMEYEMEKTSQQFDDLVNQLENIKDKKNEVPDELNGILRDYQKTGFQWLSTLSELKMGGVLADDMGLGKTIQVLSYILHESQRGMKRPVLIVAPTSLVYNWIAEIKKFTPMLKARVIVGTVEERKDQILNAEPSHILVTSYHLIRRDIEMHQENEYHSVILDEAQHIKNETSKGAKAVKQINANHRFALTGTPMENHLGELWSIFDFVIPGHLGSRNWFRNQFVNPITKDADVNSAETLSNMIKPFLLRRLKSDVLKELPDKIENNIIVEMTEEQKKLYVATVKSIRGEIMLGIDQNGINKMRIQILAGLTRLRQICCHPSVYLEDYNGDSGKFEVLEELVDELKEGEHRPLIFSQFTSILKLIKILLEKKGLNVYYLDGNTKAIERMGLVDEFNSGKGDVFLISLKAGGTGLNLTGADTVIHFDPWWNPAVEDQATDRAHRIGQKSTVHVMKLICKGTIEEKIIELQKHKKKLIDHIVKPGEIMIGQMSREEIEDLLAID